MHFPPYYKKVSWQHFFVGIFIGSLVAYLVLIYMYGSMYEDLLAENLEQSEMIQDLKRQNEALLADRSDWNTPPVIQEIEIDLLNAETFRLDSLLMSQLKSVLKQEIEHLIGAEITTVSQSEDLLISTLENKLVKINSTTYQFTVTRLSISATLRIGVELSIAD